MKTRWFPASRIQKLRGETAALQWTFHYRPGKEIEVSNDSKLTPICLKLLIMQSNRVGIGNGALAVENASSLCS
jgi:hypothetical protein